MQMRQIAFLLIGILLVTKCVEEPDEDDHPEDEDESADDQDHHDQLGENHEEDDDPPEEEEKPIPWVPLGVGPSNDDEEPIEEDLSSDQVHKIFKYIDDDQDGKLTIEELLEYGEHNYREIAQKRAALLLNSVDENQDNKASLEELPDVNRWLADNGYGPDTHEDTARSDAHQDAIEDAKFKAADRDANGGLDESELAAMLHPRLDEIVLQAQTAAPLTSLDRNGDSQLTEDEFFWGAEGRYQDEEVMQKMTSDFSKLDKNSNGLINAGEMQVWESGFFSLEEAMKHLIEVGDKNADHKITLAEFDKVLPKIWGTSTSSHIREWCDHHEL